MTDQEFELIDALYFTVSFKQLKKEVSFETEELKDQLKTLILKGWVKCLEPNSEEEIVDFTILDKNFLTYNYLATKEGLLAHNSR